MCSLWILAPVASFISILRHRNVALFWSAAKPEHLEKLFWCPWQNFLDFTEQVNAKSNSVMDRHGFWVTSLIKEGSYVLQSLVSEEVGSSHDGRPKDQIQEVILDSTP